MNTEEVHFEEISSKIVNELVIANSEIKVAMAWFTDRSLFEILLEKVKLGVDVDLILADKEENKRLDFDNLEAHGATITWISGEAFGMMHQKFCIIDSTTLINGSFNWTVNASKNNQENIIITKNRPSLVEKFLEQFEKIKSQVEIFNQPEALSEKASMPSNQNEAPYIDRHADNDDWASDLFLNSSVDNSNREDLQERGFRIAKDNNGHEGVIPKQLDVIYHELLTDTHVDGEQKIEMRARISKRASEQLEKITLEQQREVSCLEEEALAEEKNCKWEERSVEGDIDAKDSALKNILENIIPRIKDKINLKKEQVDKVEMEAITPSIKWHVVGPLAFATLFLTFYLFLFYSSTFYTILHATEDAQKALENGNLPLGEFFNSQAIKLAWGKGTFSLMIIILFTFLPLACGMIIHYGNKYSKAISFTAVFLLDMLIAYKIAEVMHDAKYLAGKTSDDWVGLKVFSDPNFYFVILLGFVAFMIWGFLLDLLLKEIDRRHPDSLREKQAKEKALLEQKIDEHFSEIDNYNANVSEIQQQIIELKNRLKDVNARIHFLPAELKKKISLAATEFEVQQNSIERKKEKYLNYLNRDQIPVSLNALKDRTSAFISGWDQYLHDQYSSHRARNMSLKAHETLDTCLEQINNKLETQNSNVL